jgi:toxin HigB-1
MVLEILDAATCLEDLDSKSLRLHKMKGDLEGYWSISINMQWRVLFVWDGDARDVYITDPH